MDKMQQLFSGCNKYFSYVMYVMFKNNDNLKNITLSDGETKLLDLLLAMSDCDDFVSFLLNLTDVNLNVPLDSRFWPGYTVLHLAVSMTDSDKLWKELYEEYDNQEELSSILKVHELIKKESLEYEMSIDIFSGIHHSDMTRKDKWEYKNRIDICLRRGCSVDIMNAHGETPIHLAFKLQKANIVDMLLNEYKTHADYPNDLSLFHIACITGNAKVVERLIKNGADIESRTKVSFVWPGRNLKHDDYDLVTVPVNSTALHLAATFHNEKVAELLLDFGADVYAQNALGLNPIHLSIGKDRDNQKTFRTIAQLLLKKATNLKETSNHDSLISYLHVAAYANDADTIKKLLQMGIDIDTVLKADVPELSHFAKYNNGTPLHVAFEVWSSNAIEILIKSGADITRQTPDKTTPLLQLVFDYDANDSSELRRYIVNQLRYDKRINESIDANGVKLLHIACHLYDYQWAKELLEKGADVNAQILDDRKDAYDWTGWTPMHFLIHIINWNTDGDKRERDRFVKLLVDYGADPLLTIFFQGESPVLLAHFFSREDQGGVDYDIYEPTGDVLLPIADLLLNNQPSYKINPTIEDGFSHFHYACTRNQVDVVKKYLDNGIDVNLTANVEYVKQFDGSFTPLHIALYNRSLEVACLLVERGANLNAVNKDKETPLHFAIMRGLIDFRLLQLMLRHGADMNARTVYDSTPVTHLFELSELTFEQFQTLRSLGFTMDIPNDKRGWILGLAMRVTTPCDRSLILRELVDLWGIRDAIKNDYNPIGDIVSVFHNGELKFGFYMFIIQSFINIGCQLDQQDNLGETALHQAAKRCNVNAIKALLSLGANVNIIASNNRPAIATLFLTERRRALVKPMLAAHTWKMKYVGLKVHKLCEAAMLKILKKSPLDENLEHRCNEELASLSTESISESLTVKSFLNEWSAVIDYPTMSIILREKVDRFFANPYGLRQSFPEFSGLLMMQYRKAVARAKVYKTALSILPLVIWFNLPYLCLEEVLKYFDNDELQHFIAGHRELITDVQSK